MITINPSWTAPESAVQLRVDDHRSRRGRHGRRRDHRPDDQGGEPARRAPVDRPGSHHPQRTGVLHREHAVVETAGVTTSASRKEDQPARSEPVRTRAHRPSHPPSKTDMRSKNRSQHNP
jgi:hypothetical protein